MINHWQQGRNEIDSMLEQGLLQKVQADRQLADTFLAMAEKHLAAAAHTIDLDPIGSFQLAYDGARKSFAAVLENQGLRATTKGGHRAVEDALRAQLVPPMAKQINNFGWMRKLRNDSEYPTPERDVADIAAAKTAHMYCAEIITVSKTLLDEMPVY